MLYPFITGKEATASKVFTLALSALVSLSHDGNIDMIEFNLNKSSPRDELYITLMSMLTKEGGSPLISIQVSQNTVSILFTQILQKLIPNTPPEKRSICSRRMHSSSLSISSCARTPLPHTFSTSPSTTSTWER